MPQLKITVLKRTLNADLAEQYVREPVQPCEVFQEGQVFVVPTSFRKPEGFCDWAWNDIYKSVVTLWRGGNFSEDEFAGWMKEKNSMVVCCTDGIRPVVFKVERTD
jgi:uncharacterized repeat protein (TIGR04076 family)